MIVLHYTAMADHAAAARVLCDPAREVSAHYLIGTDGEVLALVPEDQRAWHAGAGRWGCVTDVNSRSIGIEMSNIGTCPFAAAQMDALCDLVAGIMGRWNIPAHRVIGHSDMAPGRKIDPGARFDWRRLALEGLSIWPERATPGDFRADLARFGYTADVDDDTLLAAFRLRFRPRHTGPLDDTDRALAADLAARFGVDAKGSPQ
ncbi:N-acetylmuramoyl-L-alanine amidase [Loktanella sp. DSM 29012]|uniref:N-acetylmuramoyl-L-alanine amidase n=1 Tax=Loktanella sp. DSM 29012 TaxID=1881056 RepID=UPI0015A5B299|nr:N-acetylmuramoyl-L-alanine amidase [Loktanella sp. DSM 29012]